MRIGDKRDGSKNGGWWGGVGLKLALPTFPTKKIWSTLIRGIVPRDDHLSFFVFFRPLCLYPFAFTALTKMITYLDLFTLLVLYGGPRYPPKFSSCRIVLRRWWYIYGFRHRPWKKWGAKVGRTTTP